jgi:hypothetical protein
MAGKERRRGSTSVRVPLAEPAWKAYIPINE